MATTAANLLSRMTDLEHQDVDLLHRVMLYGPPGGGKTILSMALAQQLLSSTGRILYIDSADGWVSLADPEWEFLRENTDRFQFQSASDLAAAADAIAKRVKGFEHHEVVVVDEMSSMAEQILDQVMRERLGTKPGEIPEGTPDWTDYRPMGEIVRKSVEKFMQAGVHVILVAHSQDKTDARKVTKTMPSISPKLNEQIQKLMHVTGFVSAEIKGTPADPQYIRTVQAQPSGLISAKTRIGSLRTKVKLSFGEFLAGIVAWGASGEMATDIAAAEPETGLAIDEIPTDGLPVADSDDEPVFSEDQE